LHTPERFHSGQNMLCRGPHVDDTGATGGPVICDVRPVTVVEDSPERIALFLAAGTPTLMSRPKDPHQPKPWGPGEWDLVPSAWSRWNTLFLHAPGEWRATWVMWTPEWEFLGWYVNLQEPLWRTRWGFDIRDLQLDILVAPDRTWRWKDEDDFARSVDSGLISPANAEATRASTASAIAVIEAGAWPFDEAAADWRPPPEWSQPQLPTDDELEAVLKWSDQDSLGRF